MSMEIPSDLQARLHALAQQTGEDVDALVRRALEARLALPAQWPGHIPIQVECEARTPMISESSDHLVHIPTETVCLAGALALPAGAHGIVVFVPGHDRSQPCPDYTLVAQILGDARLGTLLLDCLTTQDEAAVATGTDLRLPTRRLITATAWLQAQPHTQRLGIGYCGANTGAAVALQAAAALGPMIRALVSHGGRPDLARGVLPHVQTPTLLIIGTRDPTILELNQEAYDALPDPKHLAIVPGATHDFAEPGALQEVAHLAAEWFRRYLDIEGL